MNALADNNRYFIVQELLKRDYCVGGLALKLNISEAAVSQHLKILKDASIISGNKRGYFKHYRVNDKIFKEICDELNLLSQIKREKTTLCPPKNKEDCPLCKEELIDKK